MRQKADRSPKERTIKDLVRDLKKKKKYASRYMSRDKSLHNVLLENIS